MLKGLKILRSEGNPNPQKQEIANQMRNNGVELTWESVFEEGDDYVCINY